MSRTDVGQMNPALKIAGSVIGGLCLLSCLGLGPSAWFVNEDAEHAVDQMSRGQTKKVMHRLMGKLHRYRKQHRRAATSLEDLLEDGARSRDAPTDIWGNELHYEVGDDGYDFALTSYGADGVEGGEGSDADIVRQSHSAD